MDSLLPVLLAEFAHFKVVVLVSVGLVGLGVQIAQAVLKIVQVASNGAAIQPPV